MFCTGGTENIRIVPCAWAEIHPLVETYLVENHVTVESFWEDHVLSGNHYKMLSGDAVAGYFAVHKGSTLVLFHVLAPYAHEAQSLFARAKQYESVTNAMVPTGDELFLSHCLDAFARMEKQAYFAVYTDKEIPKARKLALDLTLADVDRDAETLKRCGDFLDGEIEGIRSGRMPDALEIYIARQAGEVVGFGVIQYGRVVKDIASIGMYVLEAHRRRGVAANILENLRHIAKGRGCRVFSGCWYYNHNSKKSMERAGAYAKTRLLRFYF